MKNTKATYVLLIFGLGFSLSFSACSSHVYTSVGGEEYDDAYFMTKDTPRSLNQRALNTNSRQNANYAIENEVYYDEFGNPLYSADPISMPYETSRFAIRMDNMQERMGVIVMDEMAIADQNNVFVDPNMMRYNDNFAAANSTFMHQQNLRRAWAGGMHMGVGLGMNAMWGMNTGFYNPMWGMNPYYYDPFFDPYMGMGFRNPYMGFGYGFHNPFGFYGSPYRRTYHRTTFYNPNRQNAGVLASQETQIKTRTYSPRNSNNYNNNNRNTTRGYYQQNNTTTQQNRQRYNTSTNQNNIGRTSSSQFRTNTNATQQNYSNPTRSSNFGNTNTNRNYNSGSTYQQRTNTNMNRTISPRGGRGGR
ncbi:hypothetical protein [Eisenibacter elegans]|uniref:hypothetical protein n=1 Tax=Eisenibacter elegans TaxID=997 RepID=UPI00040840AB|nr:hypothetical protein [Eisenibacter elegans]